MKIPDGITEQKVNQIIAKVIRQLSPRLVYGSNTIEDIQQEGWLFAIDGLEHFQRGYAKEDDVAQALENFLRVHIPNRLKNERRKHVGRVEKPANPAKLEAWEKKVAARHNLMYPADIHSLQYDIPLLTDVVEDVHYRQMVELIKEKLAVDLRSDFLRMCDGVKIPKPRQLKVRQAVAVILKMETEDAPSEKEED